MQNTSPTLDIQPVQRENPAAILGHLTGADYRIIHELLFLESLYQERTGKKDPYSVPGQRYLAAKAGITREHASRRTQALAEMGILRKIRRRNIRGRWQTCLYRVTDALKSKIVRLLNLFTSPRHRVTYTSHIVNNIYVDSLKTGPSALNRAASPPGYGPRRR